MPHYLSDSSVSKAFEELRERDPRGKAPIERASALLYFLAFDRLLSVTNSQTDCVDFAPTTHGGRYHRLHFTGCFTDLVQFSATPLRQVEAFGRVRSDGPSPEKRVSANLLTTRLKAASKSVDPIAYPTRPAPLLMLGLGDNRWHVARHLDWQRNLMSYFRSVRSRSPLTHLAVFVLRATPVTMDGSEFMPAIEAAIRLRFSRPLAQFWVGGMRAESAFNPDLGLAVQAAPSRALGEGRANSAGGRRSCRQRVEYLEDLLRSNGILFEEDR